MWLCFAVEVTFLSQIAITPLALKVSILQDDGDEVTEGEAQGDYY